MTCKWYLIRTKPKQEERATMNLRHGGMAVFSPRLKRSRYIRGKITVVTEPLFPGYIFAFFDPKSQFQLVKFARGVNSVVGSGLNFWSVDEQIIDHLKARQDRNGFVMLGMKIKPGERVEIVDGPFAGFKGVFKQNIKASERVLILLDTIDVQARLELTSDSIKRVVA